MSSFERAVKGLSRRRREEVRKIFERWSSGSRAGRVVVTNLDPLERFLPTTRMRKILGVLYRHRNHPLPQLEHAYQQECYRHVRRGGRIRCRPAPTLVGRAVEREAFVNYLHLASDGLLTTRVHAEDFMTRLLAGEDLSEQEQRLLMSPYSAWVTWHTEPGGDPFEFAGDSSEQVRACLGLDPEGRCRGTSLLLPTYPLQQSCTLLRPTVADAGLFLFFEPPWIGSEDHGWTKPWPPGLADSGSPLPSPRPEAVHEPWPVKALIGRPLRLCR